MSVLQRKVWRDIRDSSGTLLTVVAIITVGAGSLIGSRSALRILAGSQQHYYDEYRMADLWVSVKKAPLTAVEQLSSRPEIAALYPRIVYDVILDVPGVVRPLTGRLISAPRRGYDQTINGLCVVRGTGFSEDRPQEVILSESFAREHGLAPGDRISLILNRKRESFVIVGTAMSPEYVYMVRGEGDLLPDPRHFGTLYIKDDYARDILDFQDACNDVVFRLAPGSGGDTEPILQIIREALEPYGVLATTPRSRQASNRFLSDEIAGLKVTAVMIPGVFLAVAALALSLLMNRTAERQRVIIGTLRAMGYTRREVLLHFLGYGVGVGLAGGVCGGVLGLGFAAGLISIYRDFYQLPEFVFEVYPDLLISSLLISLGFAIAGSAKGVWRVLRLEPAAAMRSRPPERGGAVGLERFPRLWNRLGFRSHMAIRAVGRNRGRTAAGVLSAALAATIMLITMSMYDSVDHLVDFQFELVARSDLDIGLGTERSSAAVLEGAALPGVDRVEPVLGMVMDVRRGRQARRLTITGLSREHRLTVPHDASRREVLIPSAGLVMSRKLADILELQVGDSLELTTVRGRRQTVSATLAAIIDSYLGLDCYADLQYLSRLVGEGQATNALQMSVDRSRMPQLFARIKELPNAQGVSVRHDTIYNLRESFIKTMMFMLGVMFLFAGVISLGSTMNASLIELGDRRREVSTLRVLGYDPRQVAGIFLRQNAIVTTMGLVLGLPLGYLLSLAMVQAYNTELYRMPLVFRADRVVITAVLTYLFMFIAQLMVYREVCRLDWQEGVKVKE